MEETNFLFFFLISVINVIFCNYLSDGRVKVNLLYNGMQSELHGFIFFFLLKMIFVSCLKIIWVSQGSIFLMKSSLKDLIVFKKPFTFHNKETLIDFDWHSTMIAFLYDFFWLKKWMFALIVAYLPIDRNHIKSLDSKSVEFNLSKNSLISWTKLLRIDKNRFKKTFSILIGTIIINYLFSSCFA